jgi:tRNA threonylcarbamoyladenosine biosynthesis protein TsaE
LKGGEVIELVSDLGGGKTTFVKGIAKGLGITEEVHSPSFTISNQHDGKKLTLYHFDFYRLQEPGIMKQELAEVITDNNAVTVIEWADIVEDILPANKLRIVISVKSENSRDIKASYDENTKYLIPRQYLTS